MKVYIAVGHGIKPDGTFDPGAVSGSDSEQTSGDVIVAEAARILRDAGLDVTDEAGADDSNFIGTVADANGWGADLLVAVHHDWSGGLDAHGFWYPGSVEGEAATRAITGAMEAAGTTLQSGWVKGRSLYVLRESKMAATLIEVGRIGSSGLDSDGERKMMGRAIAQGIADYAKVSLGEPKPELKPEPKPEPDNWTEHIVDNLPLLQRRTDLATSNDDDRRVQGLLAAAGTLPIAPNLDGDRFDGKFGRSTEKAVKTFQQINHLMSDGMVGPNTWTALLGG